MISDTAARLRENIQRVIVGKDETINLALIAMLYIPPRTVYARLAAL
jgi:MoxR-like ATPase